MGRRIDRRRTEPAGGGVAAAPLPRILAEFDLDAAHCLVIPIGAPLRVGEAEGAIGEFRVGDHGVPSRRLLEQPPNAFEARHGTRAEEIAREHARLSRQNLDLALANRDALEKLPGAPLLKVV